MNTRNYTIVSTLIFALVALVHLLRFVLGWPVQLGTLNVPVWGSMLAALVFAGVTAWGVSLLRRT